MIALQEECSDTIHDPPLFMFIQLSWQVDKTVNRPLAEQALMGLSNKVKLGNIRATYIAQDSIDQATTLVTLNSGVKEDPN